MATTKGSSTFTRRSMTPEIARELISEHGTASAAARAVFHRCVDAARKPASFHAVRIWIQDAARGELQNGHKLIYEREDAEFVNQVANVIKESNIPIEAIRRFKNVKIRSGFHEVVTKDKHGKPQITKARSKGVAVLLDPEWNGPAWPVVQPAKPIAIKTTIRPRPKRTTKTIVVLSDLQIGFLRSVDDLSVLTPMHDERAIDVALQIVADLQPDQIGYVGDFLDLAEMSRWLQVAEFQSTTQPAIEAGHRILARFEAAAGPRDQRDPTQFVAGNHDRRLREYVQKNARAAFNLRPANSTPDDWPDLTVPRLLRFEELGIEYVGEYPGGEWWISDSLVVRHNPESSHAYHGSVIAGHTHRVRRDDFSRRTPRGPIFATLYEIGCLCRLDKYSDRKSLMATSVPSNRGFVKDWKHGFAVVSLAPDGSHSVELVDYVGPGRAIFRGREFTSTLAAA